jgi:hypothetical protein
MRTSGMLSPSLCYPEFRCHSEPFAGHPEPFGDPQDRLREGSHVVAQGKLREASGLRAQGKLSEGSQLSTQDKLREGI